MHFWNISKLKEEHASGKFTDADALAYLIGFVVLSTIPVRDPSEPVETAIPIWAAALAGVSVTILGIYHCFRCNGAAEGIHFLDRSLSVAWVEEIRIYLVAILLMLPALLYVGSDPSRLFGESVAKELPFYLVVFAVEIFFFWRVGVHMKEVATECRRATSMPGGAPAGRGENEQIQDGD